MTTSIILIVAMLLLSGFFSGMEIAFVSKNRLKLEIDRKQNHLLDFVAGVFERHPGQYITSILVGNNIALVVYSLCMSVVLRSLAYALGWHSVMEEGSLLLETGVSTLVVIFVAEFLPKSIFKGNPNFYYRTFAPVLYLFYLLLYPIVWLTSLISYGVLRVFGVRIDKQVDDYNFFTRTDLADLLENTAEAPQDEENELKLFQNALDFAGLRVRDCMVPRVDIEAVSIDTSIGELTGRFIESKYSRIFVWEESIDNIVGYVNSKSLFEQPETVRKVLMEVNYVPETMQLQSLLENFIKRKSYIAVVIDEFGGTSGIISLEDVLEQIFGEIEDEHDIRDLVEKRIGEGEYVFSCRHEVKYLNETYALGIEESREYDTLAGYIIYHCGGIPVAGETLTVGNLQIRVLRTTRSRIELVRVRKVR